jgi:hypothetical protein
VKEVAGTRNQIAVKANQVKESATEWTDRAMETAAEWKEKAVTNAHVAIDRAADSIKIGTDGVHPEPSMQPATA